MLGEDEDEEAEEADENAQNFYEIWHLPVANGRSNHEEKRARRDDRGDDAMRTHGHRFRGPDDRQGAGDARYRT